MSPSSVPEGFDDCDLIEGFLIHVGPLYTKPAMAQAHGGPFVLAFRAQAHHANRYGVVHGGMLATLADTAIGANLARTGAAVDTTLTLSLTLDYIASAVVGDWIEAHVELSKDRGRVRFGQCDVRCGTRSLVRASAVFYAPPNVQG